MKVRAIQKNNNGSFDFVFGQGFTSYKKDEKEIEQDILCGLNEWKNDCFWALQNGIDWRNRLGLKNQQELLDNDIIEVIKSREGVLDVIDFESMVTDRLYSCKCSIYTIFSENFIFTYSKGI